MTDRGSARPEARRALIRTAVEAELLERAIDLELAKEQTTAALSAIERKLGF